MHIFSTRLKSMARGQLYNRIGTVIGAFLMHMTMYLPLVFFLSYLNTSTIINTVIYFLLSFAIDLYAGILIVGEDVIFLKCATGQEAYTMDIFYGFRNQTSKIISLRFIPALILMLVDVPVFFVTKTLSAMMPDTQTLLEMMRMGQYEKVTQLSVELFPITSLSCFVLLLQFLISLAVNIVFSQTFFYMLDYPELDTKETLVQSIGLLKGNWGKYLYMTLSFAPWYLLGLATVYISFLWSFPYKWATMANFYLEIIKQRSKKELPAQESIVDVRT